MSKRQRHTGRERKSERKRERERERDDVMTHDEGELGAEEFVGRYTRPNYSLHTQMLHTKSRPAKLLAPRLRLQK